jgi:predicted dehydrogenase
LQVLLIGFGSIGKRHFEILSQYGNVNNIDLVTKQDIKDINTFKNLNDISDLDKYDYFVISSETLKHYEQLKYICTRVKNKKILVEKPLYNKSYDDFKLNNKVYVAYNLRFHPVLSTLKNMIKSEEVYSANIICGQYLPSWRPDQDYRKSYSADINQGGGVLRDLSHEIDYSTWLFGEMESMQYISTKISDLEISSDDIFTSIFVTNNKSIVNLSIDYISKSPIRKLLIHTKNFTIDVDVINNKITTYDKKSNQNNVKIDVKDRNYTYSKMHMAVIKNDLDALCTFDEGMKIINIIDSVKCKDI